MTKFPISSTGVQIITVMCDVTITDEIRMKPEIPDKLEMWANAQRDGRPAEYRWRPLFNAAKFGWQPLLDAVQ